MVMVMVMYVLVVWSFSDKVGWGFSVNGRFCVVNGFRGGLVIGVGCGCFWI